jgi:isochorismate hydrolase
VGGNVVLDDWFLFSFFFRKNLLNWSKKKKREGIAVCGVFGGDL